MLLEDQPPVDWATPSDECAAIAESWVDLRDLCLDEDPQGLADIERRLVREWALELAAADRIVDVDRSLAYRLAASGFDAAGRDAAGADRLEQWQADALAGLQEACLWLVDQDQNDTVMDMDFLVELDRRLQLPEVEPVPGGSVRSEVTEAGEDVARVELLEGVLRQLPHRDDEAAPEKVAAWVLHNILRLRPFGAGTDRVAKAASSYWLLGADLFPLTVRREDRNALAGALVAAGDDDLRALTGVVATAQRRSFLQAVSALGRVRDEPSDLTDVISVISDQFRSGSSDLRRSFASTVGVVTEVFWHAKARITDLEGDLGEAIEDDSGERRVFADYAPPDHPERRSWHRKQVIDGVRRQGYFANLRNYSAWNRIGLNTPNGRSEILLSFHAVGQSFRGVIAAGMIFYRKRGGEIYDHQVVSREPYQINFHDDLPTARRRFDAWLDASMRAALEVWRRGE